MNTDEKIRRYLRNRMSEEEREKFKTELNSDPTLKEEVATHALAMNVADEIQKEKLIAQMEGYSFKEENAQKLKPKRALRIWAIAASVLLLVVAGSIYFLNQFSNDALYTISEDKYPPFENNKLSADAIKQIENFDPYFILILQNKEIEKTPESTKYFSSFDKNNELFFRAQFNLAYSFLLAKDYPQSKIVFQSIISSEDADKSLIEEAQFYLALVSLLNDETEETVEQLNIIANQKDHKYSARAEKLLNKLDSFWRAFID